MTVSRISAIDCCYIESTPVSLPCSSIPAFSRHHPSFLLGLSVPPYKTLVLQIRHRLSASSPRQDFKSLGALLVSALVWRLRFGVGFDETEVLLSDHCRRQGPLTFVLGMISTSSVCTVPSLSFIRLSLNTFYTSESTVFRRINREICIAV
ncbi:hypothetical protein SISNIDRAFT_460356 [Sistotremastrum niveocremeum HHB9708]|uniref:Uncharacterized protein n=1 Tax=Sistotremastrum niveocremeum HHB9708 TaxID=1314777 RepID=A0A164NPS5_9AGAM|nr:hypothetical protein SISNIDRAFT_460356 [Sistotremastrum niveocremeum HHB9708]